MVALFVIATISLFLVVDYFVYRARKRKGLSSREVDAGLKSRFVIPKGYFIGKGHTWVELLPNGTTRIGLDDFVQKIVGPMDGIRTIPSGSTVARGQRLFSVNQGEKTLSFYSPISGRVISVNDELVQHPGSARKEPYKSGWVVAVEPADLSRELKQLSIGREAAERIKREVKRFRDFIASQSAPGNRDSTAVAAGVTLLDGGVPVNDVLEHSTQEMWNKFEHDFLCESDLSTEPN